MTYKFNSGEGAWACPSCRKVIATGWDAIMVRELVNEGHSNGMCEDCNNESEESE